MPRPEYFAGTEYKEWRKAVLKRDNNKCRMCGSKKKLEVHHIRPYGTHPELRLAASNGITLCREHHQSLSGREDEFIEKLESLQGNMNPLLARIRGRQDEVERPDGLE